jgi:hypothetical protein
MEIVDVLCICFDLLGFNWHAEIEAKLEGLEAEYMAAAKKQAAQHAHTLATAEVCGCVPAVWASWI